jgi:hypothetical protein
MKAAIAVSLWLTCGLAFLPAGAGGDRSAGGALAPESSTGKAPVPQEEPRLEFKCLWTFGPPGRTGQDARRVVDQAAGLGFNAIVVSGGQAEFRAALFDYARKQKVGVYLMLNPVYGEWGFLKTEGVSVPGADCLQAYGNLKELNTPATPDDVEYAGPWLCIDRPEVRKYAADLATTLMKDKPDGIALDFVGYKNYRGCKCDFSVAEQGKFAKAHPELDAKEAAKQYSLASLTALYEEVRAAVKKADPAGKLAAHVYPPFDPEPLYGNRLAADYPAQTVAWFFAPHWPLDKVESRCRQVKADEHKYHDYTTGTGFIGMYNDEKNRKSPERLRAEIRTVKAAGLNSIMFAGGFKDFDDPSLAKVIADELGGKPQPTTGKGG